MSGERQFEEQPQLKWQVRTTGTASRTTHPRIVALVKTSEHYFAILGGTIIGVTLLAVLLELFSWLVLYGHPSGRDASLKSEAASPVYAGLDWAPEFWQEEDMRQRVPQVYIPFRIFGVTPWHGKYMNNDQGVRGVWRRTINPTKCDAQHRLSVWMFGGSTVYGFAVPDWATLPTYLSHEMNIGSRDCVIVSNFGVDAYVSDQELMVLEEQLKAGGRPNIVIFYDGVNDSSLANAPPGAPVPHFSVERIKARVEGTVSGRLDFLQQSHTLRLKQAIMARFRRPKSFSGLIARAQPNVALVLDNYEGNMRIARALGDAYQFKLYCFWQPFLIYGHKPLVPFEQNLVNVAARGDTDPSAWLIIMASVYREAERRAAAKGDFVFLGNVFDSTKEPLYVDEAHLGPHGNELVAQAIASYVHEHQKE